MLTAFLGGMCLSIECSMLGQSFVYRLLFIIVSKPKLILHMLLWVLIICFLDQYQKKSLWKRICDGTSNHLLDIRCLRASLNPWDPSNQSVQNFLISCWILVMKLWRSFRRLNSKLLELLFMFNRYLWVLLIWYLPSKCMLIGRSPDFYPTWSTPRFFGFSFALQSTSPTQKMLSLIRGTFQHSKKTLFVFFTG